MSIDPPSGCASCDEGSPINECPKSKRECGHHCNHSWSHDDCCWCGEHFGEEVTTPPPDPAVERANLRGLAEAATPGPWFWVRHDDSPDVITIETEFGAADIAGIHAAVLPQDTANAAFIAAANPRAVLGLLDEIDRLTIELAEHRGAPLLAAEINALPIRVRIYIRDIETRCDPTGDIQTIASLTEQRDGLVLRVRELEGMLARTDRSDK